MMYDLKNKKIGIFGLGMTGESIFKEISTHTDDIICWDDSKKNRSIFKNQSNLLEISDKKWKSLDVVFISPGIPHSHDIFLLAKENNILVQSDIELFINNNHNSKIIVITGTNGKSTTTALIGHILDSYGFDFPVGGNIGMPVLSLPKHKLGYVLELSSFQLDLIKNIDPYISVLLNITPDHLDRHGSFENYYNAKEKAFKGQGIKIIGIDNKNSASLYQNLVKSSDKKTIAIATNTGKNTISCSTNSNGISIYDNYYDKNNFPLCSIPNMPGKHNRENIAAAYAVCRSLGMKPANIIDGIKSFKGLKHRMQNVGSVQNITYYNDSKATNTSSAESALSSIENIYWLAGGVFKEDGLQIIEKSLGNIKKAYLFGESKLLFSEYLANKVNFEIFDTMKGAFIKAHKEAQKDQKKSNILLSPACASFDQFKNFEDRGNQFIDLCYERLQKK